MFADDENQVQLWATGPRANEDVVRVLDEVLVDLLGRRVCEAIYNHMEREHHVTREEIADHLDTLSRVLEDTFGKGAETIERTVAKRLSTTDSPKRSKMNERRGNELGFRQ